MASGDQVALSRPAGASSPPGPSRGARKVALFIQKLHRMLDGKENSDIIRWSEQGDSFIISDRDRFVTLATGELGPTKWRMLANKMWGYEFKTVPKKRFVSRDGSERWAYQFAHPKFRKGDRGSLHKVQRKKRRLPSPLPVPPRSTPQQIPPDLPSGHTLDVNSLFNEISVIKRHQEAILSEFSELRKSNEYLLQEVGRIRRENTTNNAPRKRQRLVVSDSGGGGTRETFAHTDGHTESNPPPPGPCASIPNQTVVPFNANAVNVSNTIQRDAVQSAINHMMISLQSMQALAQALQNSNLPARPPSTSTQPATTGHPNRQSTTHSPAQSHLSLDHQDPTPKGSEAVNLDLTL